MASYDDTATVSGTVVSIENGADEVGAKSCVVTVPPTLSGKSEVTETQISSRNMASMSDADFTLNSVHYYTENGVLYIDGTSTSETSSNNNAFKVLDFWLPSGTYYFSRGTTLTSLNVPAYLRKYDDKSQIVVNTGSFTLSEKTHLYIGLYVYQKTFSNIKAEICINLGSTAITYEDTAPMTQYSANLGRTIYGGTADIVNSTGKDTTLRYELDENDSWSAYSGASHSFWHNVATGEDRPIKQTEASESICNYATYSSASPSSAPDFSFLIQGGQRIVVTADSTIDTVDKFKTWLSSHNLVFVCPSSTPTDYTFDGQEVPTRLGYNAFWSDSGDTELTYYKDGYGYTSVTVNKTGKNIFDISKVATTGTTAGISWNVSGNEITISGTATSSGWKTLVDFKLPHKGTYHFHMNATGNVGYFLRGWTQLVGKDVTEVCNDPSQTYRIAIAVATSGQSYSGTISEIQIEVGDSYTEYEPYEAVTKTAKLHKVIYGGLVDVIQGTAEPKNLADGNMRQDGNKRVILAENLYLKSDTYTISLDIETPRNFYYKKHDGGSWTNLGGYNKKVVTFTISEDDNYDFSYYVSTGVLVSEISNLMIELGSTASDYVPHFEPFTFPPISMSTDEGENTLFANEGTSAITYRKAVD